jgi:queuine/archaeosine tRNA-ribosyltransferase
MDAKPLENAMERAERALMRIERSIERGAMRPTQSGRDDALRAKVADALAELDEIIREASV